MNNAQLTGNVFDEPEVDVTPAIRERVTKLTEIIEALQNISQSSYWHVLQREWDGELQTLASRLEKESDPIEIYRLQGELRRAKKYDLTRTLIERRQELTRLKQK